MLAYVGHCPLSEVYFL